jgi:hypothetical protein
VRLALEAIYAHAVIAARSIALFVVAALGVNGVGRPCNQMRVE